MAIKTQVQQSSINDTVVNWAKSHSRNGFIKPNLVLRYATDANWIFHHNTQNHTDNDEIQHKMDCYGNTAGYDCAALMNIVTPGQRVNGVLTWQVNENIESPTQTASFEAANALMVSQTTSTLQNVGGLKRRHHASRVLYHCVQGKDGVPVLLDGANPLRNYSYDQDPSGLLSAQYSEDRLLFRIFANEYIELDPATADLFPNPAVPNDEHDDTDYDRAADGIGAYFVLVDDEVIRVINKVGNTLWIPPGGRGVNGKLQQHDSGATVTLLGYGEPSGRWAGISYLSGSDAHPHRSSVRPGTCLASYEGYGNFDNGDLTKRVWGRLDNGTYSRTWNRAYEFTGYWFTKTHEASLTDDGTAKMNVDLVSAGSILQHQKISQNVLFRMATADKNYAKDAALSAYGGTPRNIPGDWVDYTSWDPHTPKSYPLKLQTEYAQHKAFFDHMADTTFGKDCELCQKEFSEYINRQKKGYKLGDNAIAEARAVGKHIYKESIRVYNGGNGEFEAGPLRTYGMLMIKLAKLAWETPHDGNPLGKHFAKIPNNLWNNMDNFIDTGLVWNGQLSFSLKSQSPNFEWDGQTKEDMHADADKDPLECPFESSYDNQDWYQPMLDMAELNGMVFTFTRQGEPIFIPKGLNLRGLSWHFDGWRPTSNYPKYNGEWFMSYGASLSNYTHNLDTEQVLTGAWVGGTTVFDSEFNIQAAGTGIEDGQLVWYSPKVGNKAAMQLTGGVYQIDSANLDNLVLGLSWYTKPAGWSMELDRTTDGGNFVRVNKMPHIPRIHLEKDSTKTKAVRQLQLLYNFLVTRFYMEPAPDPGKKDKYLNPLNVDGKFGDQTKAATALMWAFFVDKLQNASSGAVTAAGYSKTKVLLDAVATTSGEWSSALGNAAVIWTRINEEYLKTDVWWYALGGYDWDYYIASITGLDIPQVKDTTLTGKSKDKKNDKTSGQDPIWVIDQLALRNNIQTWQNKHLKQAIAYGNRMVDDALQRASVRSIQSPIADPRIHLGDVIYINVPGYQSFSSDWNYKKQTITNATYVTQISRNMDFQAGTYQATYQGYKYNPYWDNTISLKRGTYLRSD